MFLVYNIEGHWVHNVEYEASAIVYCTIWMGTLFVLYILEGILRVLFYLGCFVFVLYVFGGTVCVL